jgi:phospholipid/cholesterol/gamma-HCH transport system permease protein
MLNIQSLLCHKHNFGAKIRKKFSKRITEHKFRHSFAHLQIKKPTFAKILKTMILKPIATVGKYLMLMGHVFARPERMRMYFKQYVNEMVQLGVNSIGIVLLISFFIGAVITIQIKLNIESPWMPRFVVGYTTREIMLLEFSSSIMCLILAGKVGSNIASEIGTMRVTQQIDALKIMGVNPAGYLILPKITALMTMIPFLVIFSIVAGIIGAFCTCWFGGVLNAEDLEYGLQYCFQEWFIWCSFIKSIAFAFIISSVSAYFGYTVEGGSIAVGKASTDSVVMSSVLILFTDLVLTQLLMG